MDLPTRTRHLDLYLAQHRLLDKNCQAYALGRKRTVDAIEMACIALGSDREELARRPALLAIINTNSPRVLDVPMAQGLIDFAIASQLSRVSPMLKNPDVLEGTVAYMSPEQTGRMNRMLDYRSDFYSLGVTFYFLLSKDRPYAGEGTVTDSHGEAIPVRVQATPMAGMIAAAASGLVLESPASSSTWSSWARASATSPSTRAMLARPSRAVLRVASVP